MSKSCFKCGEVKPLAEFYKNPKMGDGHVNKCKECNKRDVTENRKKNIEHYRAYDIERGNRQTPEYHVEYRSKKPNGYKAKNAVSNAVRDGKMTRGVLCQFCGTYGPLHAHHRDYDKTLDVQWLCVPCHKQWHVTNGPGLNG